MLTAQQQLAGGNMTATPLPSSPYWETSPFGPGKRLVPAPINVVRPDTGRAEPRLWEYPVSWNIQVENRRHVPWKTLQDAADMPLFRKCIERRKSVCQLDFVVTVNPNAVAREAEAAGQAKTDVESALRQKYQAEIARITDWLQTPDRKNGLDWGAWTSLIMENRLKFDAVAVYPRKTFGGDLFSLEVIDGKTIKPLLDESGGRPMPPYPAYQQILYGFPRGEFVATTDNPDGSPAIPGGYSTDELLYERSIYRSESPYGMSATEIALLDGLVWMRRMGWILAEYTEGVQPASYLKVNAESDWTVPQWAEWQRALNDHLGGNTAERLKWPLMPPGVDPVQSAEVPERYKPDYDLFLIKLVCGDFGLPASEVGFTEAGALGASFHEGEEDILNRQTRMPDSKWLGSLATKLAIRQLGMPSELQVQILGLESEDEAAADAVAQAQYESGRMTLNEDRARRGVPPYSFPEADMATVVMSRGLVFLDGASKLGEAGTLIMPPTVQSTAQPGEPGADGEDVSDEDEIDDTDSEDGEDPEPPAQQAPKSPQVSKGSELAALRRFLAKGDRPRPFECAVLTAADAPDLAGSDRVVFKAGGRPGPKVSAGSGPAGSGTGS